jgi:hypothetical protein
VRLNEAYASLFERLHKVLKGLSPEDAEAVSDGRAQITIVRPGARVLGDVPGLDAALKAIRGLSEQDLVRLARGESTLKVVHKGGKVQYPIDAGQIAEEVSRLTTEEAIIKFLDGDDRLKPTELRKVAKELGIAVPASARTKPAIETHIARNLISFGSR